MAIETIMTLAKARRRKDQPNHSTKREAETRTECDDDGATVLASVDGADASLRNALNQARNLSVRTSMASSASRAAPINFTICPSSFNLTAQVAHSAICSLTQIASLGAMALSK